MMKVTRWVIVLAMVVGIFLANTTSATAAKRRRRARTARSHHVHVPAVTPQTANRYQRYHTRPSDYHYPRYTGAFHARYFDGVPSIYGMHPMRGTAW